MRIVEYHIGGYDPAAPAQNKAVEYDDQPGTYTRWDTKGQQAEQRPLTSDESARLAAAAPGAAALSNATTLDQRMVDALAPLSTYVNTATPTAAQTTAAVKLLCRVVIALIRRRLDRLDAVD